MLGFAVLNVGGAAPAGMLAAFAIMTVPMWQVTRLLWSPADEGRSRDDDGSTAVPAPRQEPALAH